MGAALGRRVCSLRPAPSAQLGRLWPKANEREARKWPESIARSAHANVRLLNHARESGRRGLVAPPPPPPNCVEPGGRTRPRMRSIVVGAAEAERARPICISRAQRALGRPFAQWTASERAGTHTKGESEPAGRSLARRSTFALLFAPNSTRWSPIGRSESLLLLQHSNASLRQFGHASCSLASEVVLSWPSAAVGPLRRLRADKLIQTRPLACTFYLIHTKTQLSSSWTHQAAPVGRKRPTFLTVHLLVVLERESERAREKSEPPSLQSGALPAASQLVSLFVCSLTGKVARAKC